jgi:hypothetical protein
MPRIFLSYARGDDGEPFGPAASFVAHLQHDLIAAGFEFWFDRVSMPSRASTIHQDAAAGSFLACLSRFRRVSWGDIGAEAPVWGSSHTGVNTLRWQRREDVPQCRLGR